MRRRARLAALGAASVLVGTAVLAVPGSPASAQKTTEVAGGRSWTVTLITGDTIRVERLPDGRQAATIEPGPDRDRISFQQLEVDDDLHVFPTDVVPYLDAKLIDADLFNVTELIDQGYDDESRSTLPLILAYRDSVDVAEVKAASVAATSASGPVLESINARAVAADKKAAERFWESVDDDKLTARSTAAPKLAGGIERIWLDRKVRANLDRSVPQIGAPTAWDAGFNGTGVTVAVLDTGIDTTHPDLAGVVAQSKNFSDSPTTDDKFGHGTHVAATVAGTGAAAGGTRKGVAPGAKVLVGKVLGDDGFGLESWILDGMEWAATSGAKVVNMSLGGGPTDGTDPMSQGLNALTEETGTLFVVSAGNNGESGEFTVGTPGAAADALTVGAVNRDESLAPFSSRGPRLDDFAVKPDITAPGVGIVAARATGTSMGTPVDAHYTAASGTSMAAPHVAGAAAILAQRHPDWKAGQLKDALASTAVRKDGLTVFEQGGGRVDVARAVTQSVHGTGTLDLGMYADKSDAGEVRKDVTYTNTTTKPVTLALDLALRGQDGNPLAADAVRLGQSSVVVAPGATVTVPITVDPVKVPRGRSGGYLAATADGGIVVHTSLGLMKEAPRHRVTFTGVGPDGGPAFVNPLTFYGEDSRFDVLGYLVEGRTRTYEVAEGTYFLHAMISQRRGPDEETFVIDDPKVEVTSDMTVTVDARTAKPVVIKTPKPAVQDGILSFYSHREFGARGISHYTMQFDTTRRVYATPTERLAESAYEFGTRWSMIAPPLTGRVVTPKGGPSLEFFYLRASQALDGTTSLPVVDVGAGQPKDYAGLDVRGKIALVSSEDWDYDQRVVDAAAAGAKMAAIIVPEDAYAWSKLNLAEGERLPAIGALMTHERGADLRALVARGKVTVELTGVPVSPYLYDVMQVSRGQVPNQIVHTVSDRNSATISTQYHEPGGESWSKEQRFGWRPWQDTAINQYQRVVKTPLTREEVVSADGTWWQHRVKHYYSWDNMNPLPGGMTQAPQRYKAGQKLNEQWYAPVVRPAIPRGVEGLTSYRTGDTLRIRIPEFADSGAGHYGYAEGDLGSLPDEGSAKLYRNGELLAEDAFAWGDFPAGGASGDYRLDLTISRTSADWAFSTRTDTSWAFGSSRPASGAQPLLPLLQLDYGVPTDLTNKAASGRALPIDLTARHQDGLRGPSVTRMAAWVSYDDGASWSTVEAVTSKGGGRYGAVVKHPALSRTNGYVSLRVRAEDAAGNSVTQTVLRAYGLK
ncbi:S8 family serine peptidase [Actinopolymorpha alba]|uniref:S8 family serine peptidase n=1 Tax=Actinopolymorpha alba TaxID=533267 RepID=UPI000377D31B|nr:S8 family serine peptidase [Actinopolymorpha alba]